MAYDTYIQTRVWIKNKSTNHQLFSLYLVYRVIVLERFGNTLEYCSIIIE